MPAVRATLSNRLLPVFMLAICAPAGRPARAQAVHYERPVTAAPAERDIGGGYVAPAVQRPGPRAAWWVAVDVALLTFALSLGTFFALVRRSRNGLVALAIGSLAYFGFYRQGCICPIGSIQNVAVALTDPRYAVPLTGVVFFFLPRAAALLVGRVFCAGACPLGAVQDLVVLRPIEVPRWLDNVLGTGKYVYLALALWYAIQPAAKRDFLICRFDPFVGFFRMTGPGYMLIAGGALLLIGLFVGRPYCRYLCPYGALLAIVSRFAWKRVKITPDDELDCGLCVVSCPFGAISKMRAVPSSCLACARCYASCPRELTRRESRPVSA
jgi:polyferredoxin